MLVTTFNTTRRLHPEEHNANLHRPENLKTLKLMFFPQVE
jgi:hypothetical protein